jgi:hypothetical protein
MSEAKKYENIKIFVNTSIGNIHKYNSFNLFKDFVYLGISNTRLIDLFSRRILVHHGYGCYSWTIDKKKSR